MPQMRKTKQNRNSHTEISVLPENEAKKNASQKSSKHRKTGNPTPIRKNETTDET